MSRNLVEIDAFLNGSVDGFGGGTPLAPLSDGKQRPIVGYGPGPPEPLTLHLFPRTMSDPTPLSRRQWLASALGGVAALAVTGRAASALAAATGAPPDAPLPAVTVHKDASCSCCEKWIAHMRSSGFTVTVRDEADIDAVKDELGVPAALRSCHTAVVGGYLVEGHVPAADVKRLLRTRARVAGLAVPGMPTGTPGMEIPGRRPDRYTVLAFDARGATKSFASH